MGTFIERGKMASSDLQWMLLKNNTSFLVKRKGAGVAKVQFTTEPNNVMNLNSFKFSGLANKKAVGVTVEDETITFTMKKAKASLQRKPASNVVTMALKKTVKGAAAIEKATAKSYYRGDLTKFAVARYYALQRSLGLKKKTNVSMKCWQPKVRGKAVAAASSEE